MKIINRHKHFLLAVCLSFLTYVIFYGHFLTPAYYFWSNAGQQTDAQTKHVPARTYLYDKIVHEHSFPFWTEKVYSGFPIYADMENAYLNPINVASILVFGPQLSYKILHILEYLVGSLSFYFLLKRKGIGLLGFASANAIFYFNTFFIDHQIHFNMIMALYLVPAAFLLADLFLEKRRLRYIVLQSLVLANAVLWGHMQSAVIIFMGIFLYMTIFSFRRMRFQVFVFYFIALTLFVTIETLPQIVPTYELFGQSSRSTGLDYLKGSLNPRMAIFSFVPYLLGGYQNFVGQQIKEDLTYNEIYFYFGISSMMLSFLALLLLKKSREIILAFVFIWIFLLFGFMDYNKLFPSGMPLITLFRDWERTAVLSSFGIALLAGIFIEKIGKVSYKNIRAGILFVLSPLVYMGILIAMDSGKTARRISSYVSFHAILRYHYFPVLEMIVATLMVVILLFFIIKKFYAGFYPKTLLPVKIILVLIIFFDLIYFSKDVLAFRLQDISGYKLFSVPAELQDKRIILNSLPVQGMESLYYSNWSPFGSSQLKGDEYVSSLKKTGLDLRGISSSEASLPLDYENLRNGLRDAGISAVVNNDGIDYLNSNELDVLQNNISGHYIEKKEGHIIMRVDSPTDTTVKTYLKYDQYWKVTIDGKKNNIKKDGVFFEFPLNKGSHLVEIYYCPWPLFQGILLSALLLAITVVSYVILRRKTFFRYMLHQK